MHNQARSLQEYGNVRGGKILNVETLGRKEPLELQEFTVEPRISCFPPRAEGRSKATGKCGFKETLTGVS